MNTVKIKDTILGDGIPKTCVSLMMKTLINLDDELKEIKDLEYDILEWRADYYDSILKCDEIEKVILKIKESIKGRPLLFTFRSSVEGGKQEISEDEYFKLLEYVVVNKLVDIIDVELFMNEKKINNLVELANKNNVKVLISNHDFEKTLSHNQIVDRLRKMQDFNADISKIAMMANCEEDVITLLQATITMNKYYATRPIVTISMGKLGMISRLCGNLTGSAMTFGFASRESAPGQISVNKLKEIIDLLSK